MAGKATKTPTTYSPSLTTNKTKGPYFNDNWIRPDGAASTSAVFRTGTVNSASGSAYAEFGNTKVIASIWAKSPRESKKAMMYGNIGRLDCNVSYATFATLDREQGSNHQEDSMMLYKALEGAIILESFPKMTVDVFALVLESGGSDLPVVTSCASLALADAEIMMYDLVSSVSVLCLHRNLVIDPNLEEENCQDGSLMISCMPLDAKSLNSLLLGIGPPQRLMSDMLDIICMAGDAAVPGACAELAKIMRSCLRDAASASQE